ncbi:MAG TPA: cytochrome P450, partial [Acidobacteriaceae bacterium]
MTSPQPIPAVSRLRCFADSRSMARNPVRVLSKYNEEFGDTFRIYLGGLKEAIVTIDPSIIQHVLKTNWENYQKSEIQVKRMGHFLGKGLLTTHGEAWRTQRRLIQKGFDRKQLDALSSIMQDSLTDSLREFDDVIRRGPVDIYPQLMKMTFAMVARSLFGARLKSEDIDLVSHTIYRAGVHRAADDSALSKSVVRGLGRTPPARADAYPRRCGSSRVHPETASRAGRSGSAADPDGRTLQRRRRNERRTRS